MKISNTRGTKILLISIIGLLIGFGIYSFATNDSQSIKDLENEKFAIIEELEELSLSYDDLVKTNGITNEALEASKIKIEFLIDSLKNTTLTLKSLLVLKEKQAELRSTVQGLVRENNELKQDNGLLANSLNVRKEQLSQTKNELQSYQKKNAMLNEEKNELSDQIANNSFLNLVNFEAFAVKEKASGKEMVTDRARKVNKLKVCYSIAKNNFVQEGTKELYVQVVGPRRIVVDLKMKRFKEEQFELDYSFVTAFNYIGDNVNQCDYLELKEKLEKGTYTVNIFDGKELITSSKIVLK